MLGSGAGRAGAGLVKGGDEAGEQMGEGLALLVCPAADGTGELGAPVVVHLVKVGAAGGGELERRAAAVLLVGLAPEQPGGDGLSG